MCDQKKEKWWASKRKSQLIHYFVYSSSFVYSCTFDAVCQPSVFKHVTPADDGSWRNFCSVAACHSTHPQPSGFVGFFLTSSSAYPSPEQIGTDFLPFFTPFSSCINRILLFLWLYFHWVLGLGKSSNIVPQSLTALLSQVMYTVFFKEYINDNTNTLLFLFRLWSFFHSSERLGEGGGAFVPWDSICLIKWGILHGVRCQSWLLELMQAFSLNNPGVIHINVFTTLFWQQPLIPSSFTSWTNRWEEKVCLQLFWITLGTPNTEMNWIRTSIPDIALTAQRISLWVPGALTHASQKVLATILVYWLCGGPTQSISRCLLIVWKGWQIGGIRWMKQV